MKWFAADATPVMGTCKNLYNYSAAVFTKIDDAVTTLVKNPCRIFYSFASTAFRETDQTARTNDLYKPDRRMQGDETEITTHTAINAGIFLSALQECYKLVHVTVTKIDGAALTPVKNVCRTIYAYCSATFMKIDQIVRIDGVYRLAEWVKNDETKSRVGQYTAALMEIAGHCAVQEGVRLIPGGAALYAIVSKTLNDVNYETIKPEKVKLLEEEAGLPQKDSTGGLEVIDQAGMDGEGGAENACKSSDTNGATTFTKISQTLDGLAQWMAAEETKSTIIACTATFAKNFGVYALQHSNKFIPGRGAFSRIVSRTLNEFARKKEKKF